MFTLLRLASGCLMLSILGHANLSQGPLPFNLATGLSLQHAPSCCQSEGELLQSWQHGQALTQERVYTGICAPQPESAGEPGRVAQRASEHHGEQPSRHTAATHCARLP